MNKTGYLCADDIRSLSEQINEFSATHEVFSTQVFQTSGGYDCLIWYRQGENERANPSLKKEQVFQKEKVATPQSSRAINGDGSFHSVEEERKEFPITSGQIWKLRNELKYKGDLNISKHEAYKLIRELMKHG